MRHRHRGVINSLQCRLAVLMEAGLQHQNPRTVVISITTLQQRPLQAPRVCFEEHSHQDLEGLQ